MPIAENVWFAMKCSLGSVLTTTRKASAIHPLRTRTSESTEEETMNKCYQFRLNGIIVTEIKVRLAVDGVADRWELVASHKELGDFAIDDNQDLADPALALFSLEVRNASIPPIERRHLPNKGWKRMTATECLALLESAGVIDKP
jgi:hypothetical protein